MTILYFLINRYYFTVGILLYYSYIVPYFINTPNVNVDGNAHSKKFSLASTIM